MIINSLVVLGQTQRAGEKREGDRQEAARGGWSLTPAQFRDKHLRYLLLFFTQNRFPRTKVLKLVQVAQHVEVMMFFLHNAMEYAFYDIIFGFLLTESNAQPLAKNRKTQRSRKQRGKKEITSKSTNQIIGWELNT